MTFWGLVPKIGFSTKCLGFGLFATMYVTGHPVPGAAGTIARAATLLGGGGRLFHVEQRHRVPRTPLF